MGPSELSATPARVCSGQPAAVFYGNSILSPVFHQYALQKYIAIADTKPTIAD